METEDAKQQQQQQAAASSSSSSSSSSAVPVNAMSASTSTSTTTPHSHQAPQGSPRSQSSSGAPPAAPPMDFFKNKALMVQKKAEQALTWAKAEVKKIDNEILEIEQQIEERRKRQRELREDIRLAKQFMSAPVGLASSAAETSSSSFSASATASAAPAWNSKSQAASGSGSGSSATKPRGRGKGWRLGVQGSHNKNKQSSASSAGGGSGGGNDEEESDAEEAGGIKEKRRKRNEDDDDDEDDEDNDNNNNHDEEDDAPKDSHILADRELSKEAFKQSFKQAFLSPRLARSETSRSRGASTSGSGSGGGSGSGSGGGAASSSTSSSSAAKADSHRKLTQEQREFLDRFNEEVEVFRNNVEDAEPVLPQRDLDFLEKLGERAENEGWAVEKGEKLVFKVDFFEKLPAVQGASTFLSNFRRRWGREAAVDTISANEMIDVMCEVELQLASKPKCCVCRGEIAGLRLLPHKWKQHLQKTGLGRLKRRLHLGCYWALVTTQPIDDKS